MIKNPLFYCSECLHVYYKFPKNKQCAICHNEMVEDIVPDLQILTCETCHSLYTSQEPELIIPENIANPQNLCGCVHKCPTNSLLSIGDQETYVGNIVLADIYKCSNCGGISFRNAESTQKGCTECHAKFIYPIHWDPDTQKVFFKCANPNHGIRLKIRDLLYKVNENITSQMVIIKKQEEQLRNQYLQKKDEQETSYAKLGKIQQKFQAKSKDLEMAQLNYWAVEERRKLYSVFHPNTLRCAVFRDEPTADGIKLSDTKKGCGAIGHIRIRKIVLAPDGTVIDREPTPISEIPTQKSQDTSIGPSQHSIPDWKSRTEIISSVQENRKSIFTQIFPSDPQYMQRTPSEKEFDAKFASLPPLGSNQLYIKIVLENRAGPINYGILAIQLTKENPQIRIGREEIANAYWHDIDSFTASPFIFDNITPTTQKACQIVIHQLDRSILIASGENSLNPVMYVAKDGTLSKLIEPVSIESLQQIVFSSYYAFDKKISEKNSHFRFSLYLAWQKPEMEELL